MPAAIPADRLLGQRHKFAIQAQPLGSALRILSIRSGIRILFPYDAVTPMRSGPVAGWLTTRDALEQLVAGSGMRAHPVGPGVIALVAERREVHPHSP